MKDKLIQLANLLLDPTLVTSYNTFMRLADNEDTILLHDARYQTPQWFVIETNNKIFIMDRQILMTNSEYFDSMFKFQDISSLHIDLPANGNFELVAQFMLRQLNMHNVQERDIIPLLLTADYLQMPYLLECCLRSVLSKPSKYYEYLLNNLSSPLPHHWFETILEKIPYVQMKLEWIDAVVYRSIHPWSAENDEYLDEVLQRYILPLENTLDVKGLQSIMQLEIADKLPLSFARNVKIPEPIIYPFTFGRFPKVDPQPEDDDCEYSSDPE